MTTAIDLSSSSTPFEPDREAVSAAARHKPGGFGVKIVAQSAPVPRFPVSIDREIDGTFLVSDLMDQVVGTGSSIAEALDDFRYALRQHVNYLRANLRRLDRRLRADLQRLEHDFPWV